MALDPLSWRRGGGGGRCCLCCLWLREISDCGGDEAQARLAFLNPYAYGCRHSRQLHKNGNLFVIIFQSFTRVRCSRGLEAAAVEAAALLSKTTPVDRYQYYVRVLSRLARVVGKV